jgi:hypothetical protein
MVSKLFIIDEGALCDVPCSSSCKNQQPCS